LFRQFKFKLFIKIFLFYLVSIILPFIITSLLLSQYVINAYKNNVYSLYDNITQYISTVMDNNLYDITTAATSLKESPAVINASSHTNLSQGSAAYDFVVMQNELQLHTSYQNSSGVLNIFFESSDVVISNEYKHTLQEFYDKAFSNSDFSYEDVKDVLKRGLDTVLVSYRNSSIMVVYPLFKDVNNNDVVLLSTIETRSVFNTFNDITSDLSSAYFVVADDTRPLLKNSTTPEVVEWESFLASKERGFVSCKDNYVALKTESILPQLNYVYIVSESEILEKVNHIQNVLLWVVILLLIVLSIIAYMMSCRSFSPVSALISSSTDESYYKLDSYDDISVLVADTINTNNSLRNTIDRQRKCINDNLFVMFLQNSMNMSSQTIDMLFADVKPALNHPFYNVILVSIRNYSDFTSDIAKLTIVETMRRVLNENDILFTIIPNDAPRIIVLSNHNTTSTTLKQILKKMTTELKNNLNIEISLNIGRQIDNLNDFSKSYEAAMYSSTLNKTNLGPTEVSENEIKSVFFTTEDKRNITNYVTNLDGANVHSFFETLISKIFIENILTYRVLSYIRYSLSETLSEIIYKQPSDAELEKILNDCRMALEGHDYMNSFKIISDCYLKTTDKLAQIKNAPSESLKTSLINYIDKNYSNPEISLNIVAQELHFSYNYLSKFFKKELGTSFVDYLHKIRIEHAKKLLCNESKSIAEIGEKVGYLSSNTFIKTFKKYEGVSPGEFRKNNKD